MTRQDIHTSICGTLLNTHTFSSEPSPIIAIALTWLPTDVCETIQSCHSMEQNTSTAYFKKLWQIPEKFETPDHEAGSDSLGALSLKFDSPNSISFTSVRKFDFLKNPLIPDFELVDF